MSTVRRVLLVGPGQLGRVLAGGLVALGVSVDPVRRGEPIAPTSEHDLVLVAVGEKDLEAALAAIPPSHRARVALLQNELVPASWLAHEIEDPTVLVVWCEKKAGRATQVVQASEAAGPDAALLVAAMAAMDVPARVLARQALPAALVVKNLYIVGANVLGLALKVAAGDGLTAPVTTGQLASTHRERTSRVLREVLAIERARLGSSLLLDDDDLLARTLAAFEADPAHGTLGRTARERLTRARERARHLGVHTPELDAIGIAVQSPP